MTLFWQEYFYFIIHAFGILVFISAAWLFFSAAIHEQRLKTPIRSLGFALLAGAFFFFLLERKAADFGIVGLLFQSTALLTLLLGLFFEPTLIPLGKFRGEAKFSFLRAKGRTLRKSLQETFSRISMRGFAIALLILFAIYLLLSSSMFASYLASVFEGLSFLLIAGIVTLQIRRYVSEKKRESHFRKQNLLPLLAFIFLGLRSILLLFYRIPEPPLVALRELTLPFSFTWQLALFATLLAFLLLSVWLWNYIKVRASLRIPVIILTFSIAVACFSSLIFSTLIFKTVENNHLQLMMRGAETQALLMQDRIKTATFIVKTIADDAQFLDLMKRRNFTALSAVADKYLKDAEIDIFRVYSPSSEIVVSTSDPRDKGRVVERDGFLAAALQQKRQVKTLDVEEAVLAPILVTRSIYPLVMENTLLGAVEVGYKFDNAFVDYSQQQTNLDVTLYVGKKRSATTIKTLDKVSRWIGSEETHSAVIEKVLKNGESYATAVDRLGQMYYSAFKPLKDINGEILGMISVGTLTNRLFESTRQQLVSTFLVVTLISLGAYVLGYYAVRRYHF